MGHHSKEIEKILGYVAKSEVIHKDDMVEVWNESIYEFNRAKR
jgi:hypothetical protein